MVAQIERNTRPGRELRTTPQSERRDRSLIYIGLGWSAAAMFFPYRPLLIGMVTFWMLVLVAIFISGYRLGAYGGRAARTRMRWNRRRLARAWHRFREARHGR